MDLVALQQFTFSMVIRLEKKVAIEDKDYNNIPGNDSTTRVTLDLCTA